MHAKKFIELIISAFLGALAIIFVALLIKGTPLEQIYKVEVVNPNETQIEASPQTGYKETTDSGNDRSGSSTSKGSATKEQPKPTGEINPTRLPTPPVTERPVNKVPETPQSLYKEGKSLHNQGRYTQAFDYFTKAAAKEEPNSLYYLGTMYLEGQGVNKNLEQAFAYISKAASKSHKNALFKLAEMYDAGLGTTKDKNKARIWYQKAADQGHEEARHRLKSI